MNLLDNAVIPDSNTPFLCRHALTAAVMSYHVCIFYINNDIMRILSENTIARNINFYLLPTESLTFLELTLITFMCP